jgi:autoinducer 2-degrading protein
MIIRIVKMSFREDAVPDFEHLFSQKKQLIRGFEGCHHLELWQDADDKQVFFTYSIWETARHLECYRQSGLFRETWAATKALFAAKPAAWTVIQKEIVPAGF